MIIQNVSFFVNQMYLKSSKIPPVNVATMTSIIIMECGPNSLVSSSDDLISPSRDIAAANDPASSNSGRGRRGIRSPFRSCPAMIAVNVDRSYEFLSNC